VAQHDVAHAGSISIQVDDLPAAAAFYDDVLAPSAPGD
jgi:hypothetical protein